MLSHPTDAIPDGDARPIMHAVLQARISVLGIEHDDLDAATGKRPLSPCAFRRGTGTCLPAGKGMSAWRT